VAATVARGVSALPETSRQPSAIQRATRSQEEVDDKACGISRVGKIESYSQTGCEHAGKVVAMSPRTFARQFQSQFGTTPAKWVQSLRVEAARQHLEGDHMPLKRSPTSPAFVTSRLCAEPSSNKCQSLRNSIESALVSVNRTMADATRLRSYFILIRWPRFTRASALGIAIESLLPTRIRA